MRLLGSAHGGLQKVLDGDLVPQSLIEQPLAGRQLAVGQDLDLQKTDWDKSGSKVAHQLNYRDKQNLAVFLYFSPLSKTKIIKSFVCVQKVFTPLKV